jgi:hypothetical protein
MVPLEVGGDQRQALPDFDVRPRRMVISGVDGALGLDFLNRFIDIHFNVPTYRLTLTGP